MTFCYFQQMKTKLATNITIFPILRIICEKIVNIYDLTSAVYLY